MVPAAAQNPPSSCWLTPIPATRALPAHTLIELSPVLLFSRDEYAAYGQYTLLDHYAFRWRDGRMALALGLGASSPSHLRRRSRKLIPGNKQARCSIIRIHQTYPTHLNAMRS